MNKVWFIRLNHDEVSTFMVPTPPPNLVPGLLLLTMNIVQLLLQFLLCHTHTDLYCELLRHTDLYCEQTSLPTTISQYL